MMPVAFACPACRNHWTTILNPGTSFRAFMEMMQRFHGRISPSCPLGRDHVKIRITQ